jgi:hypothetical protein
MSEHGSLIWQAFALISIMVLTVLHWNGMEITMESFWNLSLLGIIYIKESIDWNNKKVITEIRVNSEMSDLIRQYFKDNPNLKIHEIINLINKDLQKEENELKSKS